MKCLGLGAFLSIMILPAHAGQRNFCERQLERLTERFRSNPKRVALLSVGLATSLGILVHTLRSENSEPTSPTNPNQFATAVRSEITEHSSESMKYDNSSKFSRTPPITNHGISNHYRNSNYDPNTPKTFGIFQIESPIIDGDSEARQLIDRNRRDYYVDSPDVELTRAVQTLEEEYASVSRQKIQKIIDALKGDVSDFNESQNLSIQYEVLIKNPRVPIEHKLALLPGLFEGALGLPTLYPNGLFGDGGNNSAGNPQVVVESIFMGTIMDIINQFPEPDNLGPNERSNFYRFDESLNSLFILYEDAIRSGDLESANAIMDFGIREMWSLQFAESGTISLPPSVKEWHNNHYFHGN